MKNDAQTVALTPKEYELEVKKILDASGVSLTEYESTHLEPISVCDGEYIIDVVARFSALGASFLVLVECKHHKRRVERQDVQVLHSKVQSLGAHKGMLFSVTGFQSGAIDFAASHGIALVQLASGETSWFTRSATSPAKPPPWAEIPQCIGWWYQGNSRSIMSEDYGEFTRKALGL